MQQLMWYIRDNHRTIMQLALSEGTGSRVWQGFQPNDGLSLANALGRLSAVDSGYKLEKIVPGMSSPPSLS